MSFYSGHTARPRTESLRTTSASPQTPSAPVRRISRRISRRVSPRVLRSVSEVVSGVVSRAASLCLPAARITCLGLLGTLGACSQFSMPSMPSFSSFHLPFTHEKAPDLTPSRSSAENLIRLDAQTRSGCDVVDNIERPADPVDPRNPAPQRWVARTCRGDISYDVTTEPSSHGPTVKVTVVPGPIDRPMNPNFQPASPDQ